MKPVISAEGKHRKDTAEICQLLGISTLWRINLSTNSFNPNTDKD